MSSSTRVHWFEVRRELSAARSSLAAALAFALPLLLWSAFSYVPWIWHPLVQVDDAGGTEMAAGSRYERGVFAETNAAAAREGRAPAVGRRVNPVFLPAPHEVVRGFYRAFTQPPQ